MNRELSILYISIFILSILVFTNAQAQDPYEGYTFYASGNNAYLYDMDKNLIHTWPSDYRVMSNAYLLRDSSVFFPGFNPGQWSGGAQQGGQLQIIKWDGEVVWDFQYSSSTYCPHHDTEPVYYTNDPKEVPNVLVICYEKVGGVTSDKIVEFKPTGRTTGEIVWEWHAWDHRTNDPDDNPELLDENARGRAEWTHVNNVSYNRELDQIVISVNAFDEFMVIDHSTTTEEAAGHTGGKYGKGGDILYRWGNPKNYGCSGSQQLNGQHCARWIPYKFPGTDLDVPGAGNVIIVNNGDREAVEVEPPGEGDGIYPRDPGSAFDPEDPTWTYYISGMSLHQGSVQRLPNGNTLISTVGNIIEVTQDEETVWSLNKSCSKAARYALTYFDEGTAVKEKNVSSQKVESLRIYSNAFTGETHIIFNSSGNNAKVRIFSLNGKEVFSKAINQNHLAWNANSQPSGVYVVMVKIGDKDFKKYFNLIK